MDFSFSDDQQAIFELAARILQEGASHERLLEIERREGPRFDAELWGRMAEAGLVGVAIPEEQGGTGLGFLEVAGIVHQVGRTTAPVPFLETAVLGALPLAEFGTPAQRRELLPRAAAGELILTAALVEEQRPPEQPACAAREEGGGHRLSGTKICVPAGQLAGRVLVPAATPGGGVGVFLVDPAQPGVTVTPLDTTSGQPEAKLELADVQVGAEALLGDPSRGAAIVSWICERANAALACLALGVCEEALRLTAEYTKTRKQFDQPIAMFQAVGHREADAYIDTEAVRLTAWQAAWRISEGLPAAVQVAVAKHWACEGGSRVVHAAQHLHGGVGVDREYPLHRYFLTARHLELTLGGGTQHLLRLGQLLGASAA